MVFEKSISGQEPSAEDGRVDYERECFKNLREFARAFHLLESARVKKNFGKQGEQISSAIAECRAWYASAINFLLENSDNPVKLQRFWDGLGKQLDRISPEAGIMYFEEIQTNITRQTALYRIFQEIAKARDGAKAKLVGDDEPAVGFNMIDVRKIFFGIDRVQAALQLGAEFPTVEIILPEGAVAVSAAEFEVAERKKRFAGEAADEGKKLFYVFLGKNDFDRQTGRPNAKVLDMVRRGFQELISD